MKIDVATSAYGRCCDMAGEAGLSLRAEPEEDYAVVLWSDNWEWVFNDIHHLHVFLSGYLNCMEDHNIEKKGGT
jgi:hypothetical protein